MTGTPEQPRITLRTPGDLVELLPYLFDFYPANSIVVLRLGGNGEGPRLGPGSRLRLDIPGDPATWADIANDIICQFLALPDTGDSRPEAAVIYLTAEPRPGEDGIAVAERLAPLAGYLAEASAANDVTVRESLCLSDSRWWSYTCQNLECCDPSGTPIPSPDNPGTVTAGLLFAGATPGLPREEFLSSLEPITADAAGRQRLALQKAQPDITVEWLMAGGASAMREQTGKLLHTVMTAFQDGAEALDDDDAANLLIGLQGKIVRDQAVEYAEDHELPHARRLWHTLIRRCVPPRTRATHSLP